MNRLLLIIIILIPITLFADLYDEAMKYEAKGDYYHFKDNLNRYFYENINDVNQDGIIEKLIYSSTLFSSIDETLDFLNFYVKYMENRESRFRIYKKIGEVYELSGNRLDAGLFYEKAAYVTPDFIDYNSLLNSIDMLIELGNLELSLNKLKETQTSINSDNSNRFYSMLCRVYYLLGDFVNSEISLNKIDPDYNSYRFLSYELLSLNLYDSEDKSVNKSIIENGNKLISPNDYISIKPEITDKSKIDFIASNEFEIFLGTYYYKSDAAGLINILEQMNLAWYFDDTSDKEVNLYCFTDTPETTISSLKKLGINVKEENVKNIR